VDSHGPRDRRSERDGARGMEREGWSERDGARRSKKQGRMSELGEGG
jgi:hypothetical protein